MAQHCEAPLAPDTIICGDLDSQDPRNKRDKDIDCEGMDNRGSQSVKGDKQVTERHDISVSKPGSSASSVVHVEDSTKRRKCNDVILGDSGHFADLSPPESDGSRKESTLSDMTVDRGDDVDITGTTKNDAERLQCILNMLSCISGTVTLKPDDTLRDYANAYEPVSAVNGGSVPSSTPTLHLIMTSIERVTDALFRVVVRPSFNNNSIPRDDQFMDLRTEVRYRQQVPRPLQPPKRRFRSK